MVIRNFADLNYTCIIDRLEFKEKPVGMAQIITASLNNMGNQSHTLNEIAAEVSKGKTLLPFKFKQQRNGKIEGKINANFIGTNLILLDIDEGLTIRQCVTMHRNIGLLPNMIYTSFSHQESKEKYRVLYCLPYMLNTPEEYAIHWEVFNKFYKEGKILDKTSDVSRMYYGTNHKPTIYTYEPFDVIKLADHLGMTVDTLSGKMISDKSIIDPKVYENLSKVEVGDMTSRSELIRRFEACEINEDGAYHKLRSLMFVYYHNGMIDRFLELAPLNKSKFDRAKWEYDLRADIEAGRMGHTETYKVMKEIGSFEKTILDDNKKVVESNYLDARLEGVQAHKELDIRYDKYLPLEKVKEIMKVVESGANVLMIADTGGGKTYSVVHALKELNIKGIISVPNRMNAQQNSEIYNIGGSYAGRNLAKEMLTHDIVTSVWDMIGHDKDIDFSNHVIIQDEVHSTIFDLGYRRGSLAGVSRVLKTFKGKLSITATPTGINLDDFTHIYRFRKEEGIEYNVKVYLGFNESQRLGQVIQAEGKVILLENKKKSLRYYKHILEEGYPGQVDIVTSDNKDESEIYASIASEEKIPDNIKYLLCTTVMTAGVNILNEDVTDVVVIGIKNITTIKQFVARSRKIKKLNVHIFLIQGYDFYTYNIKEERKREAAVLERRAWEIEKNIDRDLLDSFRSLRRNKLKRDLEEVEEDYQALDEDLWSSYYSKLSEVNFITALREYYEKIEIFKIEKEVDETFKEFEALEEVDEVIELSIDDIMSKKGVVDDQFRLAYTLSVFGAMPRGRATRVYKDLKELYPDLQEIDLDSIKLTAEDSAKIIEYGKIRSEGYDHKSTTAVIEGEIDINTLESKVSFLLYLHYKDNFKSNSPAFNMMKVIQEDLPKNQKVTQDKIREICGKVDNREYEEGDRYSNTIKEIQKVVPIKKVKGSDYYEVGSFDIPDFIDSSTVESVLKAKQTLSVDKNMRVAKRLADRWQLMIEDSRSK